MTRGSALNCRKPLTIGYRPSRTAGAPWSSGLPVLLTEADLFCKATPNIDVYLAEADIPPRPRKFDWYIRRPSSYDLDDETFWGVVGAATTEGLTRDGLRPSTMAGPAKEAMASFYRD